MAEQNKTKTYKVVRAITHEGNDVKIDSTIDLDDNDARKYGDAVEVVRK